VIHTEEAAVNSGGIGLGGGKGLLLGHFGMKDLQLTFRPVSHADGKRTINFFHDSLSFVKI
jgi:hypothetical protein